MRRALLSHSVVTGGATPVKKPSVVNRGGKWAVGRKTEVEFIGNSLENGGCQFVSSLLSTP